MEEKTNIAGAEAAPAKKKTESAGAEAAPANETTVSAGAETAPAEVTSENTDSIKTDKKEGGAGITILYPYKTTKDDGYELKHSIRSVLKNLVVDEDCEDANILVFGYEKPSWLQDKCFIKCDTANLNEKAAKIKVLSDAVTCNSVHNTIIFMSDDMYLINPCQVADMQCLISKGKIADNYTKKLLEDIDYHSDYDYENHTPCCFNKKQLSYVLAEIEDSDASKIDIRSYYYNALFYPIKPILLNWPTDDWALPIANMPPRENFIQDGLNHKKFMSHETTAYGERVVKLLDELFPKPSDFECLSE
jgi:hypothetical protein